MRLSRAAAAALALALAAPSPTQAPASVPTVLVGKLVRVEGGRLAATELPSDSRLVAFYFGAGWCGPCRAFVPELRAAYPRLRARRIEVVFVSDDASCGAMRDYMVAARMPWPALDCRSRGPIGWLRQARGAGLPGLLIYNRAGRLLETSWFATGRSTPRAALDRLLVQADGL